MTIRPGSFTLCWGVLVLVLVSGCERGPGSAELERELQARLDTSFQQDLFRVESFRRTGSAPFRDIETGVSGVYVYYDARLEFLENYSLTQWLGLNVATLAFAVGATESGVSGFSAKGNSRGDQLSVHGRLAYSTDSTDAWVPQRDAIESPSSGAPVVNRDDAVRGVDQLLRDTRTLLARQRTEPAAPADARALQELHQAVQRIDLARAKEEGMITLGSGPPAGTYHEFGLALAHVAEQRGNALFSAESAGSVENASRLQAGLIDFGLVQSDVLQLLYEGATEQYSLPSRDLRAVASLWPEAVHLVTLERTGIRETSDLLGRTVAIGQRGSGSRINAVIIGIAARLQAEQLPVVREIPLADAIRQLESGSLDALFLTAAVPSAALQALAARRDDVRFVDLPMSLVGSLDNGFYAYYPLTIEARSYPGQKTAVTTLGLTAALATSVNVADERVERVLDLLMTGGEELAQRYYRAAFISRETMRLGLSVPLHPAAERYYRRYDEQGSPAAGEKRRPRRQAARASTPAG